MNVIEKNEGAKIDWVQEGTRLTFSGALTVDCAIYQRDWYVGLDVCMDANNNLVLGVGVGRYYVAQILIPPTEYTEPEEGKIISTEEGMEGEGFTPEPIPFNMDDVTLTLWSINELTPTGGNA